MAPPEQPAPIDIETLRQAAAAAAAAAQAAADALAAATTNGNNHKRKPELPPFDTKHIDIWIQRVEAAYTRAGVTTPEEKFAHLESKIAVDLNPKLNEFLFGDATAAKWTEFIQYLRDEYGATKRQKAAKLLNGIRRDGRRPSQLFATIKEQTKGISVDDIHKEMIMRELPTDVQRAMAQKIDTMTAEQTANLADAYFDREGHQLFKQKEVSINEVTEATSDLDLDLNDVGDINAVGRGQSRHRQRSRPRFSQPFSDQGQRPANTRSDSKPPSSSSASGSRQSRQPSYKQICYYHEHFGEKAKRCESNCYQYSKWQAKQGNGSVGQRA